MTWSEATIGFASNKCIVPKWKQGAKVGVSKNMNIVVAEL